MLDSNNHKVPEENVSYVSANHRYVAFERFMVNINISKVSMSRFCCQEVEVMMCKTNKQQHWLFFDDTSQRFLAVLKPPNLCFLSTHCGISLKHLSHQTRVLLTDTSWHLPVSLLFQQLLCSQMWVF